MADDFLHGGALDIMQAKFPNAPTPWVDLSTGINPWSYPIKDISLAAIYQLPTQAAYHMCRHAMADAIKAPIENLLLAAGSEVLIRLLPTVLSLKKVAVLSPSYGDHLRVWRAAGCEIHETNDPLGHSDTADIVVICNPNNPDGRVFGRDALMQARAKLAARGGWLIIDEAYADLEPQHSLAAEGGAEGLIILRSLGKFYGLAGLRLGAMLAPPDVRAKMAERLGVWNISGPALEIATRAYQDVKWGAQTRERLTAARWNLDAIFQKAGIDRVTGTDLYRYIQHDHAQKLWKHLAQNGIYVRRFTECPAHLRFGLPSNRIATDRLVSALSVFRP